MPVELHGAHAVAEAPWVNSADVFRFITHDTDFAWVVAHPGSEGKWKMPPQDVAPGLDPVLAGHLRAWHRQTPHAKGSDFVFPSFREEGRRKETALRFQFRRRLSAAGSKESPVPRRSRAREER